MSDPFNFVSDSPLPYKLRGDFCLFFLTAPFQVYGVKLTQNVKKEPTVQNRGKYWGKRQKNPTAKMNFDPFQSLKYFTLQLKMIHL